MVKQIVERMLDGARQQLLLKVHRDQARAGVDVFVTGHLFLQDRVTYFDLDLWFGSRHDAVMKRLFLQPR